MVGKKVGISILFPFAFVVEILIKNEPKLIINASDYADYSLFL
jgi:hypothetical protein